MFRKQQLDEQQLRDRLAQAARRAEEPTPESTPLTPQDRLDIERKHLALQISSLVGGAMRECKMTQADLAKEIGVSEGRVSQILSGRYNLTLNTLASLSLALRDRLVIQFESGAGSEPEDEESVASELAHVAPPLEQLSTPWNTRHRVS